MGSTKDGRTSFIISNLDGASEAGVSKDATVIVTSGCVVIFDSAGGSEIPGQIVQYGEKIVKPEDPAREGYYFAGWYTDFDRTKLWDFENDVVCQNMTLYAKWSDTPLEDPAADKIGISFMSVLFALLLIVVIFAANIRRVAFDVHGGIKVKTLFVRKGAYVKDVPESEKDGYEFVGWFVDLNDEDAFDLKSERITSNMKLHAKWEKKV